MALYYRLTDVGIANTGTEAFDTIYSPGEPPAHSGIFRCKGCGREVVAEKLRKLPPQDHHQHSPQQGSIQWRLSVFAQHEPH
jgi:hypothetical protein